MLENEYIQYVLWWFVPSDITRITILIWNYSTEKTGCLSPRSDLVPFAGDCLERSYLFYDRPSTLSSNAPALRGQSRLSGFCCANRLCVTVRSPCHHNSRMRTFDENSCAISITSPRSLFRPRTQQVWWDHREKSRRASHTMRLPGKVPLAGKSPGKWDLMWTQGMWVNNQGIKRSILP